TNIRPVDGGTPEAGSKAGLPRSISTCLGETAAARAKVTKTTGDDVREGLVAVVSVKAPEPLLEGQTQGKLGSPYVRPIAPQ
ncbi:DNA gyrase subunit B, partial [Aliarcobacter butzleri]